LPRTLGLGLLLAVSVPWAMTLTLVGAWLITTGVAVWPELGFLCVSAGATIMAAGQLVFLVCAADRCFPLAGACLGRWIEAALVSAVLVGIGCVVGALLFRVAGAGS